MFFGRVRLILIANGINKNKYCDGHWPAGQQRARSRIFHILKQECEEFSQSHRALAERIQKNIVLAAGQQRARSRVVYGCLYFSARLLRIQSVPESVGGAYSKKYRAGHGYIFFQQAQGCGKKGF